MLLNAIPRGSRSLSSHRASPKPLTMDGPNNQDLSSADTAGSAASNAASAGPAGSRFLDTSGIEEGRQNQRGCRITRLSNELFLMIIDRLHDDIVAKLCLRRVCRRFRHVLVRNCRGGVWPECGCAGCWKYIKEEYKDLDLESKDTLRARLRRDTLCSHCLARCDLPDHPMSAPWRGCKFSSYLQEQLYCSGCNCRHPCRAFSDAESLKPWHKRICIGREGVLRICEHRHVTWADIEAHMAGLLMERRAGTASRDLRLNCDHPKHRYRHSLDPDSELASLRLFPEMLLLPTQRQDTITLKFSIQQHLHSVLDLDTRSRFEGDQVRLMFGKHHPSADDSFVFNQWEVPSSIEQRCFADPRCRCISHELAEANTVRANMTASDRDSTSTSDDSNVNDAVCPIEATVNDNIWGFPVNKRVGHWSSSWDHRPLIYEACNVVKCFLSAPTQNKQCVQAKYYRGFKFRGSPFDKEEKRFRPNSAWYHALDPDSYTLSHDADKHGTVWPACRNPSCANYYRLYQTLDCCSEGQSMHFEVGQH